VYWYIPGLSKEQILLSFKKDRGPHQPFSCPRQPFLLCNIAYDIGANEWHQNLDITKIPNPMNYPHVSFIE